MKLTDPELRALVQETDADSGCLTEELLLRAGRGELSEHEREVVSAHMARCGQCARDYQTAYTMRVLDPLPARRFPWLALAAAATFLIALGGLVRMSTLRERDAQTIASLESRLRAAARSAAAPPKIVTVEAPFTPRFEMPIVDLDPDVVRGGSGEPAAIEAADVFTLILHLAEPVSAAIAVSIENAAGEVVWKETWKPAARAGTLTLTLDRKQLGPGSYRVRIGEAAYHFVIRP